jgi:EAL domain-containing protein (putative c-di-GMP-specific phosphodiesterase class I)
VDYIKIDGSFMKELDKNASYKTMVQSIVDFAKGSGIKTIAEHIESREVLKIVNELGIDYSQGFLLGKPALTLG